MWLPERWRVIKVWHTLLFSRSVKPSPSSSSSSSSSPSSSSSSWRVCKKASHVVTSASKWIVMRAMGVRRDSNLSCCIAAINLDFTHAILIQNVLIGILLDLDEHVKLEFPWHDCSKNPAELPMLRGTKRCALPPNVLLHQLCEARLAVHAEYWNLKNSSPERLIQIQISFQ